MDIDIGIKEITSNYKSHDAYRLTSIPAMYHVESCELQPI